MSDTNARAGRVAEAITEWFGERCDEPMKGCACCDAWAEYDALTAVTPAMLAEARREGLREAAEKAWEVGCPLKACQAILALLDAEAPAQPKPDVVQAFEEIERIYYVEGKDAGWRAAHMRAIAQDMLGALAGGDSDE